MDRKFNWLAQHTIYRNTVELLAVVPDHLGNTDYFGQPLNIVFTRRDSNVVIERPTLEMPVDAARSLMQALWDAGIRPTQHRDPNGELSALKAHIGFAEHVAKALLHAAKPPVIVASMDDL